MNILEQKLKEFCQAIVETKEYQAYKTAAKAYENDKEAQELLNDFQMAQQTLAIFRQGNFPGQEEQKGKVENLSKEVRQNKIINEWVKTQRQLKNLTGDLAISISGNLDFPFTLPPQKGCGCGG